MASFTSSDATPILKELYPDNKVREQLYKRAPLLGILPKNREAYGERIKVPLKYGDPQGRSATFATGRTNMTASKFAAFDVTTVNDYAFAQIDGEAIDKSKNDKGSFIRAMKNEMDGAMRQLKRSLVHALYRNGGGAIGRISTASTVASTAITLATPSDVVFFEVNQELAGDTTDGTSGAVHSGTATLTAVNRATGELTTDSNWSTQISGLATSDYLFVAGDFGAKLKGLDAWVPASAPGATSFFGVDRSTDTTRLGGVRDDLSGQNIEEAIIDALELVAREGGEPDVVVLHTLDFANLQKSLGSRVSYDSVSSFDAPIGYRTIKLMGPAGEVQVIADSNAIPNVMWVLQLDTWMLHSMGDVPKYLDNDGMAVLRTVTTDAVEVQLVYRAQLACSAPGWNGRFVIGS
jgi:hypothetical protein